MWSSPYLDLQRTHGPHCTSSPASCAVCHHREVTSQGLESAGCGSVAECRPHSPACNPPSTCSASTPSLGCYGRFLSSAKVVWEAHGCSDAGVQSRCFRDGGFLDDGCHVNWREHWFLVGLWSSSAPLAPGSPCFPASMHISSLVMV